MADQSDEKWIETPGLAYVRDYLVPEAVDYLNLDRPSYRPVLILGPTGSGKSYLTNMILKRLGYKDLTESKKSGKPPVRFFNCATITESMMESELFGHEPGTASGLTTKRNGILGDVTAEVVVLDEIGAASEDLQAKLLTFLENGEYRRVGKDTTDRSSVKILATTNLTRESKKFRPDFPYRFHIITVPALYQRRHDIPFLLKRFASGIRWARYDLLSLMAYDWPGNVRELESFALMLERYQEYISHWPPSGSVLQFLRFGALPGMPPYAPTATSWLPKTVPLGNLPDFIFTDGFDESIAKFCPNLSFFPEVDDIGIDLSELDELVTRTNIHAKSMDGSASGRETDQEPHHIGEPALASYNWEREWLLWCDLMGQDPYSPFDIIACIAKGDQTRLPDSPSSGGLKMRDIIEFNQLKKAIRAEFCRLKEHPVDCNPVNAENRVPTLEEALPLVLDRISVDQYKRLWMDHCVGIKLDEIKRKYPDVKEETIKSRLRRFKADKK